MYAGTDGEALIVAGVASYIGRFPVKRRKTISVINVYIFMYIIRRDTKAAFCATIKGARLPDKQDGT